jgi:ribosomal protein S18 acetylase RimI-like enzyme
MPVVMRSAVPGDAFKAAELIYSTGPDSFNLVYGSHDRALGLISRMFSRNGNIASYEYSTVAVEQGTVLGIMVLLEKKDIQKTQAQTGVELLRMTGPLFLLLRMPVFVRQARLNPEPCEDELFVADVAVSLSARGRGIGKMLMEEAERVARERKLPKLSLGVSKRNLPAIGLYKSLGYRVTMEFSDHWLRRRYGFPGVFKMVKAIKI